MKFSEISGEEASKIFAKRNVAKYRVYNLSELLVKMGLATSKSNARRLVQQGGVKINDIVQKDFNRDVRIKNGMIFQVGKKNFIRIKMNNS